MGCPRLMSRSLPLLLMLRWLFGSTASPEEVLKRKLLVVTAGQFTQLSPRVSCRVMTVPPCRILSSTVESGVVSTEARTGWMANWKTSPASVVLLLMLPATALSLLLSATPGRVNLITSVADTSKFTSAVEEIWRIRRVGSSAMGSRLKLEADKIAFFRQWNPVVLPLLALLLLVMILSARACPTLEPWIVAGVAVQEKRTPSNTAPPNGEPPRVAAPEGS